MLCLLQFGLGSMVTGSAGKYLRDPFQEVIHAVSKAGNLMGEGRSRVLQALLLLEEAKSWVPLEIVQKLPKSRAPQYPWPEVLLFWALAKSRTLKGMFSTKIRARKSYGEFPRITDLLEKAGAYLQEAWLAYLYRHGLPSGFKPVRSLYRSAGLTVMFFTTIGFGFLSRLLVPRAKCVFARRSELHHFSLGVFGVLGAWQISLPKEAKKRPVVFASKHTHQATPSLDFGPCRPSRLGNAVLAGVDQSLSDPQRLGSFFGLSLFGSSRTTPSFSRGCADTRPSRDQCDFCPADRLLFSGKGVCDFNLMGF